MYTLFFDFGRAIDTFDFNQMCTVLGSCDISTKNVNVVQRLYRVQYAEISNVRLFLKGNINFGNDNKHG